MHKRIALLVIFFLAPMAAAEPVTFTHTGSGSGYIGAQYFPSSAFTISAVGDTDDRRSCGFNCFYIDHQTASIDIVGVGNFDFMIATRTYSGGRVFSGGRVGFSRGGNEGLNLYDGPTGIDWDMRTSIGPITGTALLHQWPFFDPDVETSGGWLVFDYGQSPATFEASVGALPNARAVPTVPVWGLICLSGIVGLLGLFRLRRNQR